MGRYRTNFVEPGPTIEEKLFNKLKEGKINVENYLDNLDRYNNRATAAKAAYLLLNAIRNKEIKLNYSDEIERSLVDVLIEVVYEEGSSAIKLLSICPPEYWDHKKIFEACLKDKHSMSNAVYHLINGQLQGKLKEFLLVAIEFFNIKDNYFRTLYDVIYAGFAADLLNSEDREEVFQKILKKSTISYWMVVETHKPYPLKGDERQRIINRYDKNFFDWISRWHKDLRSYIIKIQPIKDILPDWVIEELAGRAKRTHKLENMRVVLEKLNGLPEEIIDKIAAKAVMKTLTKVN